MTGDNPGSVRRYDPKVTADDEMHEWALITDHTPICRGFGWSEGLKKAVQFELGMLLLIRSSVLPATRRRECPMAGCGRPSRSEITGKYA